MSSTGAYPVAALCDTMSTRQAPGRRALKHEVRAAGGCWECLSLVCSNLIQHSDTVTCDLTQYRLQV